MAPYLPSCLQKLLCCALFVRYVKNENYLELPFDRYFFRSQLLNGLKAFVWFFELVPLSKIYLVLNHLH